MSKFLQSFVSVVARGKRGNAAVGKQNERKKVGKKPNENRKKEIK